MHTPPHVGLPISERCAPPPHHHGFWTSEPPSTARPFNLKLRVEVSSTTYTQTTLVSRNQRSPSAQRCTSYTHAVRDTRYIRMLKPGGRVARAKHASHITAFQQHFSRLLRHPWLAGNGVFLFTPTNLGFVSVVLKIAVTS